MIDEQNMFDEFDPELGSSTPAPQPAPANMFDEFDPDLGEDKQTSFGGALVRGAERGLLPAIGSLPAMGMGAELGAAAGALGGPLAPVTVPAGAFLGGLTGMFLGATAISTAQEWGLSMLPESWKEAIGQSDRQRRIDEEYQGTASFIGGMIPYALTMRPSLGSVAKLPANATAFERLMAHPVGSRVFGGAILGGLSGGQEAGMEIMHGEEMDWQKIAIATGFGVIFNKPTRLGTRLTNAGARAVQRARGTFLPPETAAPVALEAQSLARINDEGAPTNGQEVTILEPSKDGAGYKVRMADGTEQFMGKALLEPVAETPITPVVPEAEIPTVAQAADAKVMGPGITEEVFMGAHQQAPEAQMTAQDMARTEASVLRPETIEPDVRSTARRMEPELFDDYARLQAERDDLESHLNAIREQTGDAPTPAETDAFSKMRAIDAQIEEIAPQVRAALRRAADHAGTEMIDEGAAQQVQSTQPAALGSRPEAAPISPEAGALQPRMSVEDQATLIAEDMMAQAIAAGRTPAEAELLGRLHARRYITRAGRFKNQAAGSPLELYRREGPTVRGFGKRAPLLPTSIKPEIAARAEEAAPTGAEDAPVPVSRETPASELESIDPATIKVDAERFQFKEGGDESGVTERLQGVETWDPRLAGTSLVWRDAQKQNWIADGHQRLGLAKRLTEAGQEGIRLNAFVLDEAAGITDVQARAIAAAKNIAEGTGTAIDAAKVIRAAKEMGYDLPPLPPRSVLYRDGRALAELGPDAFGMVVNEAITPAQGAIVARLVRDPADQVEAIRLLSKADPENLRQAEMIVRDLLMSGTDMMKQESLFGEEAFASSIVLERAKIADEAVKLLKRDKTTFRTLVDEAERIEGAGENVLDQQANQSRLSTDEKAADLLTQLAFRAGPVSDELSAIARRFKAKEISGVEAARSFLGTIRRAVEEGVDTGADAGGAVAGAVEDGGPELFQSGLRNPSEWDFLETEPGIEGLPQTLIPGVKPITDAERMALQAGKPLAGGNAPPPKGGLFDTEAIEDTANQLTLFQEAPPPDSPEFENWFGSSKVVDAEGKPLVVYHGTSSPKIDRFKSAENEFFFTENPEVAKEFGYRQEAVYLSLKNPLIEDVKGKSGKAVFDLIDRAKAEGFDGVIAHNVTEGGGVPPHDQIVAFDPTQIKSTANRGTFDPNDPRILFQPAYHGTPHIFDEAPDGFPIKPGEPFNFVRNTEGAKNFAGNEEWMALDPHGRWMNFDELPNKLGPDERWEKGTTTLGNPLYIDQENGTWKQRVSDAYGGLKGAELTQALRDDGYDGIVTFDKYGPSEIVELAQTLEQKKRGSITLEAGKKPLIKLFGDADASTMIHETGHQWLEELMRDAAHPDIHDVVKSDFGTVRKWLSMADDQAAPTVKQHEKFARSFEQYVREGVAPSASLGRVFAAFKNWLTEIYRTIKGLGSPINEDIRGVFDRLLELEPNRTVIAPEIEGQPTLAGIHTADAEQAHPAEADPIADRIIAERDAYASQQPPEILDELARAAARLAPADAGPETGAGGEPGAALDADSGGPGALPLGSASSGEPGAVQPGGAAGAGEGNGAPAGAAAGGGAAAAAGLRSDGPGAANAARAGNPLSPSPTDLFGPEASPFIDKAGNIRVENLTTDEDVGRAIHAAADANNDFIGDRRGVITDGQVLDLADALGMDAETLSKRKIGQAFNAESIVAARKLLIESATQVSVLMKKAADGSDADVMAYAEAKDRHQMIQGHVAGITAEAGRALRAFRSIAGTENAMAVDQLVRNATGKTLFQLRQEAKLGAALDTPQKVSKFMQDAKKPGFGDMVAEYWINGLVSGPKTQITNIIGNTILSLTKAGPDTAVAALIGSARRAMGRKGSTVRMGEVGAQFAGAARGIPAAIRAAIGAIKTGRSTRLPGEDEVSTPDLFHPGAEAGAPAMLDETATIADVLPDMFGMVRGITDAVISVGKLVSIGEGAVPGAPLLGFNKSPLGAIPDIAYRGKTVLPVGSALRVPTRFLAAADSFFRAVNYSMEKNAIAYRTAVEQGLEGAAMDARIAEIRSNPSEAVMEASRTSATELTLMARRSEFVKALSRMANTKILGFPLFKFVAPFINTPANIIEQAVVHRTPIGLFSPEVRADLAGRNGTVAQDTAMARMLLGSALAVTFGALAAKGLASGSGPSDPDDQALWRLGGNQAHSVRIGDMWYQVNQLGPIGILMGIAADMYDVSEAAAEGDLSKAGAEVLQGFTQNILDASFMTGPADLIQALEDPQRYGEQYIRNFLSSVAVPFSGAMGQTARTMDPYSRQARDTLDSIKAKIPGMSMTLLPRLDIWGNPIPNRQALGTQLGTGIYMQKLSSDPVNIAMAGVGYWPGMPDRSIRGVELTDEQYNLYAQVAGRMTKQRLDMIVTSPDWATWPIQVRSDVIRESFRQSRETARGWMMSRFPQIPRDAVNQKLAELRGEQ